MVWQDAVLTTGTILFAIALVPSVLNKEAKPALSTSLLTGAVLVVFAVVYVTLSLWFSAITTTITGIIWFILAAQKLMSKH